VGSILGATIVSMVAKRFSVRVLISVGYFMVSVGYLVYTFSFWSVAIGFMVLGFLIHFLVLGL
jgi:hypothetical protein